LQAVVTAGGLPVGKDNRCFHLPLRYFPVFCEEPVFFFGCDEAKSMFPVKADGP